MRTNVYIDGFNLYYGCLKGSPHKWLDLAAFCQASFPPPRNQINRIRYFTAHVNARPNDPQQPQRQQAFLRALRTIPHLSVHLGSYLEKPTRMPLHPPPPVGPKTVEVMKSEEKGSDVNIACYLLVDAFDNEYDAAVVISNDSDLAEPIRLVRQKFHKPVIVLHPCGQGRKPSFELRKVASKSLMVDASLLPTCQFPPTLTDTAGRIIHKPTSW
ncbi:hypothetical protein HK102_002812 [Quaeritorhiza haematococci]|nr:hypothetical protein HK102_002812 [Quaeritorhiza haematococci]